MTNAENSDLLGDITNFLYEITLGRLDKRWWWRDWLKPMITKILPLIPIFYII
jgi:hypothetical protein